MPPSLLVNCNEFYDGGKDSVFLAYVRVTPTFHGGVGACVLGRAVAEARVVLVACAA